MEARAHLGATRRNDQSKIDKLRFSCEGLVEKGKWEEAAVIAEMWVALAPDMRSRAVPTLSQAMTHSWRLTDQGGPCDVGRLPSAIGSVRGGCA